MVLYNIILFPLDSWNVPQEPLGKMGAGMSKGP